MVYLTGDTHGDFRRIAEFTKRFQTTKEDILIILGDAGINFAYKDRDDNNKRFLQSLPIIIFAIHGNHEKRPYHIPTYQEQEWHGGIVYVEPEHPDILFAKDGEIFDVDGKSVLVIGGAYSVDCAWRVEGRDWWADEQPSEDVKNKIESVLESRGWKVDVVLSHTTPYKYVPREMFLSGLDQTKVDTSTEKWLDFIEDRLSYEAWHCGHFHTDKQTDKLSILFEEYKTLTNAGYGFE